MFHNAPVNMHLSLWRLNNVREISKLISSKTIEGSACMRRNNRESVNTENLQADNIFVVLFK